MGDTDNEKRSSVFTVRDAENAMMTFTVFAIATVVGVFLHEIVLKRNSITDGLYAVMHNVSEILSAATLLTLIDEGVDIMFLRRTREERRKQRAEGYQQAVQEFSEWNTRRLEAEARGRNHLQNHPPEMIPENPKRKNASFSFRHVPSLWILEKHAQATTIRLSFQTLT